MGLSILIALALIISLPLALRRRPSAPAPVLAAPLRATLALAGTNLAIMTVTCSLTFLLMSSHKPFALTLPMILGPVLSLFVWNWFREALPFGGARRWAVTLGGMSPYLLLIGFALYLHDVWVPAHESPQTDMFHAWLGSLLLGLVGTGAMVLGILMIGLLPIKPRE